MSSSSTAVLASSSFAIATIVRGPPFNRWARRAWSGRLAANPSTLAYGCNNLGLINDIALSSSTVKPGDTFTKTWQVANTGTCEWKFNYRLVFVSGEDMDGVGESLGNDIAVNKWTKIKATMIAPKNQGTYTAYWRLTDTGGHAFGASLAVTIKVKNSYP